jgi:hypothetical protein
VPRLPAAPLVAAAALAAAAAQSFALRADRLAAASPAEALAAANAPPLVRFASVALGGFRGVIADALWFRADRLQDERRFVELVQLADWITALDPANEEAWVFHAWNMAYNVSFLLQRPEDRWRWVEQGVSLLRDRGVPLNPDSAEIRRNLGWFFQHKIGMEGDAAGPFYRTEWAREIAACLGEGGAAPPAGSIAAAELAGTLGMDADAMAALEAKYGPVDWRVPAASALYWGSTALDCATEDKSRLPCLRMVYQSLCTMAFGPGRLVGDPEEEGWTFRALANPGLADSAVAAVEAAMEESPFSGIRHAYVGALREKTVLRALQGREAESRACHEKLRAFFAANGVADGVPAYEDLPSAPDDWPAKLLDRAGFR